MTDRPVLVREETHRLLSVLRARMSAKRQTRLTWDEFFETWIRGERRRSEVASWLYTVGMFIAVTVILLWPVYTFAPSLIPLVFVLGALIAAFSTYVLAPYAARKMKIFKDAPPAISEALEGFAKSVGLRRCPVLRIAETPEINAYAYSSLTGGGICLTRGLVRAHEEGRLPEREIRAIIGHEIGHLVHNDLLRSNLALSWVSVFDFAGTEYVRLGAHMAGWGVALGEISEKSPSEEGRKASGGLSLMLALYGWLTYIVGTLLKVLAKLASTLEFHLGRVREIAADDTAAELVDGVSMARALEIITELNDELVTDELAKLPSAERWQVQPRNPTWIDGLWDTHPPTDKRVSRQRAFGELLSDRDSLGIASS
jgi:heat shock protein HtpX